MIKLEPMKTLLSVFILLLFVSCSKHVTPKRVEKKITDGTWKVFKAISNNELVTEDFKNYQFNFYKDLSVKVSGAVTQTGSWSVGESKNPAILFLNFGGNPSVFFFSDDWKVNELSKTDCIMKRNDPVKGSDEIHFRKI